MPKARKSAFIAFPRRRHRLAKIRGRIPGRGAHGSDPISKGMRTKGGPLHMNGPYQQLTGPFQLSPWPFGFSSKTEIPEKDEEDKDEEGRGDKKDKGSGGMGGGGSEKKDKPDDSEKKDKEGGDRAEGSGELRKMGANKVYGGWFTYSCAEAALDEPKQEKWLLTVAHQKLPLGSHS